MGLSVFYIFRAGKPCNLDRFELTVALRVCHIQSYATVFTDFIIARVRRFAVSSGCSRAAYQLIVACTIRCQHAVKVDVYRTFSTCMCQRYMVLITTCSCNCCTIYVLVFQAIDCRRTTIIHRQGSSSVNTIICSLPFFYPHIGCTNFVLRCVSRGSIVFYGHIRTGFDNYSLTRLILDCAVGYIELDDTIVTDYCCRIRPIRKIQALIQGNGFSGSIISLIT